MGIGGVFHGAVEVEGWEWSYGYCERGTGVYRCRPRGNPMYKFRESVELGRTSLTRSQARATAHLSCCTGYVMHEAACVGT
jgi:hypothetical protein